MNEKASEEYGHWAEQLAERIVSEKKEPFVIASGITTSGPTHLGTLCEFLFPAAIYDFLKRERKAEFVFVADIMDAFDSVPSAWEKYSSVLTPHLGKPLARVPDPEACHASFGEHFLADVEATMRAFGANPKILKADEMYAQGKYDAYAKLFFERLEEVKQIVFESSLKQELPKWWSPIMPICVQCGKIATTQVTSFKIVGEDVEYSYSCDKNAKYVSGCGFKGSNKLSDHAYKITWRLDWPSRQDFLNAAAEGGGVDHFTRGGSWGTAKEIHSKIFGKSGPVPFKFGFILFQGKKYSKSKGIGMGVNDLLRLMPPELIKFALLRPDIQENVDFNPEPANLLRLFEEFAEASTLSARLNSKESLSRAEKKRAIAFSLSASKIKWRAPFSDVLLYRQLYDWKKVGELLNDAEGVNYLRGYADAWIKEGRVPEDYAFSLTPTEPKTEGEKKLVLAFANALNSKMNALDIHNLVFSTAQQEAVPASELFKILYACLINKQKGPKMGKLVEAAGVEKIKRTLLKTCGQ
ncbi:lysine--tRNA ligase [Candidatus Micrarchaeota archaeon]|nr:lysine--tRNA ligase [Candidatus Micrarchaeota archaeon]